MPTILAFGNSHLWPFVRGYQSLQKKGATLFDLQVLDFRAERFQPNIHFDGRTATVHTLVREAVQAALHPVAPDYIVTTALSAGHWVHGMVRHRESYDFLVPALPQFGVDPGTTLIPYDLVAARVYADLFWQFALVHMVQASCARPIFHLEAPPPVASEALMLRGISSPFKEDMEEFGYASVAHRFKQWWIWCQTARDICAAHHIAFLAGPPETRDAHGFLREDLYSDGLHGSDIYGEFMARELIRAIAQNAGKVL